MRLWPLDLVILVGELALWGVGWLVRGVCYGVVGAVQVMGRIAFGRKMASRRKRPVCRLVMGSFGGNRDMRLSFTGIGFVAATFLGIIVKALCQSCADRRLGAVLRLGGFAPRATSHVGGIASGTGTCCTGVISFSGGMRRILCRDGWSGV